MSYLDDMVKALRGGINPMDEVASMPRNNAIATGAANMIGDLATLPKRAIENSQYSLDTGNYDPAVPMEAATTLATGGMPMAEKGAAGIFGGKLAKTADLKALQEAQAMTAGGKFSDDIFHDTGWFRSPADHKWRFEIPDNNMKLSYWPTGEGDVATSSMGALVSHPELYKAYPNLQAMTLALSKDSRYPQGSGFFNPGETGMAHKAKVEVNAPDHRVARSVAAHELQHGVQAIEDFQFGSDPSHIAGLIERGLRKRPELLEGNKFMDAVDRAEPIYKGLAGEVEARNVQGRLMFSPESRRGIAPWYTQDTPTTEQFTLDRMTGLIKALREK